LKLISTYGYKFTSLIYLYAVLFDSVIDSNAVFSVHLFICATPTLFPRGSGLNFPLGDPSQIAKLKFTNMQALRESEKLMGCLVLGMRRSITFAPQFFVWFEERNGLIHHYLITHKHMVRLMGSSHQNSWDEPMVDHSI
jgi:hypothetical protein